MPQPPESSLARNKRTENYARSVEIKAVVEAYFKQFPELYAILGKLIDDKNHPLNLIASLKNPKTRPTALMLLRKLAENTNSANPMTDGEYREFINNNSSVVEIFFKDNGDEFGVQEIDGRKYSRKEILKRKMLVENPTLYSVSNLPSLEQWVLLDKYAAFLRKEILPKLQEKLEEIISPIKEPTIVRTRAKSAHAIIDKIQRMRDGRHWMKTVAEEYVLADMPDALGGRIIVPSLDCLLDVMSRLQESFGGDNIYERENLYTSPRKKNSTYRIITYTVAFMGVPCEIQITTLFSSLAADIHHNTAYKPEIGFRPKNERLCQNVTPKGGNNRDQGNSFN